MLVKGEKENMVLWQRENGSTTPGCMVKLPLLHSCNSARALEAELTLSATQKFQLEQDLSTLEDYRLYLNSLLKGGNNP